MTDSYGAGQQDVYVVRIDVDGDSLWTSTIGGADREFASAVTPGGDGGYILAGATRSFGAGGFDMYAVKIDAAGDSVWAETYGGGGDDYAWAIAPALDGGYVLAGETDSFGAGQNDVYLVKIDASGQLLWERTFGGALSDVSYSIAPLANGGFIVAGWTKSSGAGSGDIYLIKVDDQGE
jgi:outer membrane protein assembly factor BamB